MAKFNAGSVKSISTGKVEFRTILGEFLDGDQGKFRLTLVSKGYTEEMAEKIVDAVLSQVFTALGAE